MMKKNRFKAVPAVYLFLEKDNELLFMLRQNTGYQDGMYMVPGGHVEANEAPTAAMVREAKEELGITVSAENLSLVHMMYRPPHDGAGEYMDLFFRTSNWSGSPTICEPDKCAQLKWFARTALPENMSVYVRVALHSAQKGTIYTEFGWEK